MNPLDELDWPARDGGTEPLDQPHHRLRAAAVRYVTHGWRVLPGSVWDGQRYTLGHVPTPVDGLVPVMLSGRSFGQPRQASSWWSVAPYTILARAGADFDVVSAPTPLVGRALQHGALFHAKAPVFGVGARAWLLVRPGFRLRRVPGVRLAEQGSVVALPPTPLPGGQLRWWTSPEQTGWCPGDGDAAQAALMAALDRPEPR
ncbi:hypothetical protein [Amycolatopsis cihanbeyliensis]|uniref:Bifunctional DNA primase/polymerase-like protein n=1 Tax=Amycolatopsis cihanbeyliensis TaxID=1128664 RepID=A0A542DHG8_AMYCI|nr:hypothetical protein [Amycolatopsis cihanbeyliensis]TQJ02511.1 hypothetical protein FB471_2242 [Amycolatopsis cihanbeyliensis]